MSNIAKQIETEVKLHKEWKSRILDWKASGMSASQYSKKYGHSSSNFYKWIRRYEAGLLGSIQEEHKPQVTKKDAFIPVAIQKSITHNHQPALESAKYSIRLPNGIECDIYNPELSSQFKVLLRSLLEV